MMSTGLPENPTVFISYSHDSPAHRAWVAGLAAQLVSAGIDVLLDQWNLGLGDDITRFMESSVTTAQRVLVVCTDEYVRKANEGIGGVGYERLIVTAEIVRDIGTNKFIPVIRGASEPKTPHFLATRLFIDFTSDELFEANFEQLVREIHSTPALTKPPLGRNPFSEHPDASVTSLIRPERQLIKIPRDNAPDVVYETAVNLARANDLFGWRQLVKSLRPTIREALRQWREKYESQEVIYSTTELAIDEIITVLAPRIVVAMAGVESGLPHYADQISLAYDLIEVADWPRSGPMPIVELPATLGFVYQALHGATCVNTAQTSRAMAMATLPIHDRFTGSPTPLWRNRQLVGWPEALGRTASNAWNYLYAAPTRWGWLSQVFGDEEEFHVAIVAYYMLLNLNELADFLSMSSNPEEKLRNEVRLQVPPLFAAAGFNVIKRAMQLLARDKDHVRLVWEEKSISRDLISASWPVWVQACRSWLAHAYHLDFWGPGNEIHESLIKHL